MNQSKRINTVKFTFFCLLGALFLSSCSNREIVDRASDAGSMIIPPKLKETVSPPLYPWKAWQNRWEGRTRLRLLVNELGRVEQVRIAGSSGYDVLDSAAVEYGKTLSYEPASRAGKPVYIWIEQDVQFKFTEGGPYFHPRGYAYQAARIMSALPDSSDNNDRRRIQLLMLLNLHSDYVEYCALNPYQNSNEIIKEILTSQVTEMWMPYMKSWPMPFMVFQDYLNRYPRSDWTGKAVRLFQEVLLSDLKHVSEISGQDSKMAEKRKDFVQRVRNLITDQIPGALKNKELEQFIESISDK